MKAGQAYWRDGSKSGMPLGSSPQGIYMVTSGKHYNAGCCFDYGNGEISRTVCRGAARWTLSTSAASPAIWGSGAGNGPWVMADLEGGVLLQVAPVATIQTTRAMTSTYVTAIEKNNGTTAVRAQGRRRDDWQVGHLLQRRASRRLEPDEEAGVHHSRQRWRLLLQQHQRELREPSTKGPSSPAIRPTRPTMPIQANIVSAGYGK